MLLVAHHQQHIVFHHHCSSSLPASIISDNTRTVLPDHHHRRVGIGIVDFRHNGGIDYPQVGHASHSQVAVHHRSAILQVGAVAHATRARRVVAGGGDRLVQGQGKTRKVNQQGHFISSAYPGDTGEVGVALVVRSAVSARRTARQWAIVDAAIASKVVALSHGHACGEHVHRHRQIVRVSEVGRVNQRRVKGISRLQTDGAPAARAVNCVVDVKVALVIEQRSVVLGPLRLVVHAGNEGEHLRADLVGQRGHDTVRPGGVVIAACGVVGEHHWQLNDRPLIVDVVVVEVLHGEDAVNVARVLNVTGIVYQVVSRQENVVLQVLTNGQIHLNGNTQILQVASRSNARENEDLWSVGGT